MEKKIACEEESHRISGACFEAHKEKGCGFWEAVCHECLELEFGLEGIPFQPQVPLALAYKGRVPKRRRIPGFGHYPGLEYERIVL